MEERREGSSDKKEEPILTNVYGMLLLLLSKWSPKLFNRAFGLFIFTQDCVRILVPRTSTRDSMSRRMNRSLLRRAICIERLSAIQSYCHVK